jgi:hypothetical protein
MSGISELRLKQVLAEVGKFFPRPEECLQMLWCCK